MASFCLRRATPAIRPPQAPSPLGPSAWPCSSYAQPVFTLNQGDVGYSSSLHTAESLLTDAIQGLQQFVFQDAATSLLFSPPECFRLMTKAPPAAFLVCGQITAGSDGVGGQSQPGSPVLFVVQAPMVPPDGFVTSVDAVWPHVTALAPTGYVPPGDSMFPICATVAATTRRPAGKDQVATTRLSYLPEFVFCLDGLSACKVGWVTSSEAPLPSEMAFFTLIRGP